MAKLESLSPTARVVVKDEGKKGTYEASANALKELLGVTATETVVTDLEEIYLETVIDATTLASIGTSPAEILPALGANNYPYVNWDKSFMEYHNTGTGTVTGTVDHLLVKDTSGYVFRRYADEGLAPSIGTVSIWNLGATPSTFEVDSTTNKVISSEFYPNEALVLQSVNSSSAGTNFTSVDTGCFIVVKLYYQVRTVGVSA